MNIDIHELQPLQAVQRLIDRHGTWRILRAVLAAALKRREVLPPDHQLPDHLRRDIGLPPLPSGKGLWPPGYQSRNR